MSIDVPVPTPEIQTKPLEAPKSTVAHVDAKATVLAEQLKEGGVREGMTGLAREAARSTLEAKQADPDRSKHLVTLDGEEVADNAAYLKSLRDPDVVGREKYGKGVVNGCHKDVETTHESEEAQEDAMEHYKEKIDAGVADPAMIGIEMNQMLGVSTEVSDSPTSYEQILPRVDQELQSFVEKGMISSEEAEVIKAEAGKFSALYHEGYADADPSKVYEVTRDMSRMIAYQTRMDKNVLVGSDHGERHILRGNMKFADQVITGLEKQGVSVSAKDKVLVHAIIIMHDVGYTTGAAQAPEGFQASKDHPVAGAYFVDANKGYMTEMFGADAVPVIQESILDHSYVGGAFEATRPEGSDINPALVRGITSVVDSLGVTAETKVPAFFNNPDTVRELFKLRLAGELTGRKIVEKKEVFPSDEQKVLYDKVLGKRKDTLRDIASRDPNPQHQEAFMSAVDSVNGQSTDVLGQFTGEVTGVDMVRHEENGQLVPEVHMEMVGELGTLMRNMFGGKAELQQFAKAMKDLGMTKEQMQKFHDIVAEARAEDTDPDDADLTFTSDKAVIRIDSKEQVSEEFEQMREVFAQAAEVNQEWKVVQALESLDVQADSFGEQMATVYRGLSLLSGKESIQNALQDGIVIDQLQSADPVVRKEATSRLQTILQADVDAYLLG